jgi:hypothetical protein
MFRTIVVITSAFLVTGCVLPPVRGGAGVGGGAGSIAIRRSNETRHLAGAGTSQVRLAFTPLAMGDNAEKRRADLSMGWAVDWMYAGVRKHGMRHGPFVELVGFRRQEKTADRQGWRHGATVLVDMQKTIDDDTTGYGAAVGGLLELAQTEHGPALGGGVRGELGIGLAARVGVRHVDGGTYVYGLVSVEFRTPGIASWLVIPQPRPR